MSNYPDGTHSHDAEAPWNAPDETPEQIARAERESQINAVAVALAGIKHVGLDDVLTVLQMLAARMHHLPKAREMVDECEGLVESLT